MKIIFIVGSFEKGKDGVGDYTHSLSEALLNNGHRIFILALHDSFVTEKIIEEGTLRIPQSFPEKMAVESANRYIKDINPDLISLQFVYYGYSANGLFLKFQALFSQIGNMYKLHIMFHEIWVDIDPNPPLKLKITGFVQKLFIKWLVKTLKPQLVTTSNRFYQNLLAKNKINAQLLPLFSNIKPIVNINYLDFERLTQITATEKNNYFIITHFGTWHGGWELGLLSNLFQFIQHKKLKVCLISLGNPGNGFAFWQAIKNKFQNSALFIEAGFLSPQTISNILFYSDAGLCTTPVHLLGKSGSYMAMKEHGLPTITVRNLCMDEGYKQAGNIDMTLEKDYSGIFNKSVADYNKTQTVAEAFLNMLQVQYKG